MSEAAFDELRDETAQNETVAEVAVSATAQSANLEILIKNLSAFYEHFVHLGTSVQQANGEVKNLGQDFHELVDAADAT